MWVLSSCYKTYFAHFIECKKIYIKKPHLVSMCIRIQWLTFTKTGHRITSAIPLRKLKSAISIRTLIRLKVVHEHLKMAMRSVCRHTSKRDSFLGTEDISCRTESDRLSHEPETGYPHPHPLKDVSFVSAGENSTIFKHWIQTRKCLIFWHLVFNIVTGKNTLRSFKNTWDILIFKTMPINIFCHDLEQMNFKILKYSYIKVNFKN